MTDLLSAARIAYDAVRAHQSACGDPANPPWEDATDAHASYLAGAELVLAGLGPQDRHDQWVRYRLDEGWRLGSTKDSATRMHPWLVPWGDLPERARSRSRLFGAVVTALVGPADA